MKRFVKETRIAPPPAKVFAFHESPQALASLFPPWESMRVAESSGSLVPGSRVVLKGRVAGIIPVRWVAVHTAYAPPHLFADRQESGPFAMWEHRHEFLDDGAGGRSCGMRWTTLCRSARWASGWRAASSSGRSRACSRIATRRRSGWSNRRQPQRMGCLHQDSYRNCCINFCRASLPGQSCACGRL